MAIFFFWTNRSLLVLVLSKSDFETLLRFILIAHLRQLHARLYDLFS